MRAMQEERIHVLIPKSDKRYFLGNLNDCARDRLRPGGTDITIQLKHEGETYTGAWVTQECARKVWHRCQQHGDPHHAFDLFYKIGATTIKIEADRIAAFLGVTPPKSKKKGAGRQQQNFSQPLQAVA